MPPMLIPDTYNYDCYRAEVSEVLPTPIRRHKELTNLLSETILNIEIRALTKLPNSEISVLVSAINEALVRLDQFDEQSSEELGLYSSLMFRFLA